MRIRRILNKVFLICMLIFLTGCGNQAADKLYEENFAPRRDKIYDKTFERIYDTEVEELEGEDVFDKLGRIVFRGYHKGYSRYRASCVLIIVICEIVGGAIMIFSRNNNKLFRTGLKVFCIGIPLLLILSVFGIGIFNNLLLY